MTTEIEGVGAEQKLNIQSELDPKSVVTFVYRGENPYMRFLARGLQARGVPVNSRELSQEEFDAYQNTVKQYPGVIPPSLEIREYEGGKYAPEEWKQLPEGEQKKANDEYDQFKQQLTTSLIGTAHGIIVTDFTLSDYVHFLVRDRQIRGYNALDWGHITEQVVIEKLTPVIEQIRAQWKRPVLLQRHIGDHINIDRIEEEERQQLKSIEEQIIVDSQLLERHSGELRGDNIYTALIKKNFDLPIVPATSFGFINGYSMIDRIDNPMRPAGNTDIETLLQEMGIDSKDTVLLTDHHLRKLSDFDVQARGLDQVEIVRICPCCLAIGGEGTEEADFKQELQELGFKLFPVHVDPSDEAIDNLMGMIEKKKAELAAKGSSTPEK